MNFKTATLLIVTSLNLLACAPYQMNAQDHRNDVADNGPNTLTVGKVQREIQVGMSGEQVAEILGSPNVVTSDEKRRESWIYDKISTDKAVSGSMYGNSYGSAASSSTQKTLTVIIKFDANKKVRDFAYHSSKF